MKEEKKITVMSYNIRLGILSSTSRIAEIIRKYNPDIVALQETGKFWKMGEKIDQYDFLTKNTGFPYHQFAPTLHSEDNGFFGIGVISRYPIENSTLLKLHREIDEQRVLLYVKFKIYENEINFFNCHLSINEKERIVQAYQISVFAGKQKGRIIIAGDINDEENSFTYMEITKKFFDSKSSEEKELKTHPVPNPKKQYDYIFYRGDLKITEHLKVLREDGSDHYPVMASFAFIEPFSNLKSSHRKFLK